MDTLISFRLPSQMVEQLDALAGRERRSRGFMVREAIDQFIAQHSDVIKKPAKPKARKKPATSDSLTPA